MRPETSLRERALEEASRQDPSLSGLARFARMLAPGSSVSVQSYGSPARPRYSAALAALVMGASLQVQAQMAPDHAPPTAAAPPLFAAGDSILSRQSRDALGSYSVRQQHDFTPVDDRIGATSVLLDKQETRILGVPVFNKMTCEVILVPFPDGHLIPGVLLPQRLKTQDAALDLQLRARDLSDHKMLDRLMFYHEDSHCDAASWSSAVTDELEHGDADKLAFNAAANHLSRGIKAAAVDAVFPDAVLRQYSPEQFGKILAGERYADARAALHLGQYMLVQQGASIQDYERIIDLMLHVRQNEAAMTEHYHVMNDHDTAPVLKEVLKTVKQAHADGAKGLSAIFGEAAVHGASPDQMDQWSERSSVLARAITQTSLKLHTPGILNAFEANLIAHENNAGSTFDQVEVPAPAVAGSKTGDESAQSTTDVAQASTYSEVSRLRASLKEPSEHEAVHQRMR